MQKNHCEELKKEEWIKLMEDQVEQQLQKWKVTRSDADRKLLDEQESHYSMHGMVAEYTQESPELQGEEESITQEVEADTPFTASQLISTAWRTL